MKYLFLIPLLTLNCWQASAQNTVDDLGRKYRTMEYEGLLKLHERHVVELEAVKKKAMAAADLTLATQASDEIKALKAETIALETKLEEIRKSAEPLPKNEFYKMTYHNGKTGTEHGAKIFVNFERLPLTDFAGNKLSLVITAAPGKDSETSHEIFVFDQSTGKEVGKVSALGRGKTKKILLTIPPSETLKLAVAVKGKDALHVNHLKKGVPELYLDIEK